MQKIKIMAGSYAAIRILSIAYIVVSVLRILVFFIFGYSGDLLYALGGNFSIIFPFWGLIVAGETGSIAMGIFMILYWVSSGILLVVSYVSLHRRKSCAMLQVTVLCDILFAMAFTGGNILYGGFMALHMATFVGSAINYCFWVYLRWYNS